MSFSDPTNITSLGKGDTLQQQVLASFPLCDLTEEDLSQNPQFCKLLFNLTQHVDSTGVTAPLKTDLDKAEQKLQSHRRNWLRSQGLVQALKEMVQEHSVRKHYSALPPDQNMFFETMDKCLLVAQCVRMLDPSSTTEKDQPRVLGLEPQHVQQLLPVEKNVQRMKQSLPQKLEKHLQKKCLSLLCYCRPEWENDSENLKCTKLSHLAAQMDTDRKRMERLRGSVQESTVLLQRQTQLYFSELLRCVQLLQTLVLDHRLKVQGELDRKKLDYFEGKCELLVQKIRSETVDVQLDTYRPDTVSAHRQIRETLESELKSCREEKDSVEAKLGSFEVLGRDFQTLAEEYGRLQREIETRTWALEELSQYHKD